MAAAEEGKVIACHTEDEFDAQMAKANDAGKLVLIDFMTTWCGPCQMMAPVYAECAKEYPAAVFLQVDCDELQEVAEAYDVQWYPTFFFIRNGETLESFTGYGPDKLRNTIEKYYDGAPASASVV